MEKLPSHSISLPIFRALSPPLTMQKVSSPLKSNKIRSLTAPFASTKEKPSDLPQPCCGLSNDSQPSLPAKIPLPVNREPKSLRRGRDSCTSSPILTPPLVRTSAHTSKFTINFGELGRGMVRAGRPLRVRWGFDVPELFFPFLFPGGPFFF